MSHAPDEIAAAIANGHAYEKHVERDNKFTHESGLGPDLNIHSRGAFEDHIRETLVSKDTKCFATQHGHDIFYNEKSNTFIAYDPNSKDLGSCYRPEEGVGKFNEQFDQDVAHGGSPDRDRIANGFDELQSQKQAVLEHSQDRPQELDRGSEALQHDQEHAREEPERAPERQWRSTRDIFAEQEQEWDRERDR